MEYTVRNIYDISGETTHRKVASALKAASKREGEGWTVYDEEGNQWDQDFEGKPAIVRYGEGR